MTKPAITIEGVSKAFSLYTSPADILLEFFLRKPRHDVFWALRDINLSIAEGERVGIVGANGAGKTTLLKIITDNLTATTGRVTVHGKLSSMLSLTSFLNDHDTGLENIRFNLAVMGIPNERIAPMTEEIVDFTELGSFIHLPVRTYSSGMNARLAFAISTAFSPDILVIDEVLGVGDGYFIGKATARMLELCHRGRSLLYVSHSLSSISLMCNRVVWMDKGAIRMDGPVEEVLKAYEADFRRREDENVRVHNGRRAQERFGSAFPEDLAGAAEYWRLRILPDTGKPFRDIHYIADCVATLAGKKVPVSMELHSPGESQFDVLNSEWGRIHEHRGRFCRALSATTGKQKGGHLLLRKPTDLSSEMPLSLEFAFQSTASLERLIVEYLDDRTGEWVRCNTDIRPKNAEGWQILRAEGLLPVVDEIAQRSTVRALTRTQMGDVKILDATLVAENTTTLVVRERQPFTIVIKAEVIRPVPALDIGLRIFRSDGVFVFWQSTGQTSGNIAAEPGLIEARFEFNPNYFPGGKYHLTAVASNGWNPETNYPYSEIFDRRINILDITVTRELEKLDFGAINQRVKTFIAQEPAAASALPGH